MWKWGEEIRRAAAKVGIDTMSALEHPARMKKAGFINVEEAPLKAPLGQWPKGHVEKRVGAMGGKDLDGGLEGISTKLLSILGYKEEEVNTLLKEVRSELRSLQVSWDDVSYSAG